MPIISSKTRAAIRQEIGFLIGDNVHIGVVDAASSVSALIDTDLTYPVDDDDRVLGGEVTIYSGTLAGESRGIKAFTAATDTITPSANFSGDPSSLSYEIHKRFRAIDYNNAILMAEEEVAREMRIHFVDEQHILDNRLSNGNFFLWANGASSAPDGWTFTGAGGGSIARESSLVKYGVYAAKLTNGASNTALLSQAIGDYARFREKTVTLKAYGFCGTADRARLSLTDGVSSGAPWYSSYHDGNGWSDQDDLKIQQTIAANPTELTVGLRIETGTSLLAYFSRVYLYADDHVWEYDVPSGTVSIHQLLYDSPFHGRFDHEIDPKHWYVKRTNTRQIALRPEAITPYGGGALRILGQKKATLMTADTDNTELPVEFIVYRAAMLLDPQNPKAALWERMVGMAKQGKGGRFPGYSKIVEPL